MKIEKKYCNCAQCGVELLGQDYASLRVERELVVAGRIKDRPYCDKCIQPSDNRGTGGGHWRNPRWGDEASAYQENAIRDMEDS